MTIAKFFSVGILAIVCLFASSNVRSQARPSPKTNVISVDPLGLAFSNPLTIRYEFKSGPVNSYMLRAHIWPSPGTEVNWTTGIGIGGSYRIYIADSRALTGLSVGPTADIFFSRKVILDVTQTSAITVGIGGDLAYKWIFDDFSVEPLFGLRFGIGPRESPSRMTGIQPVIGVAGGYAWQ